MDATPQQGSSLGNIFGVLAAPTKTFEQLARKPTWFVALVLAMVFGVVLTAVIAPIMDWDAVVMAEMEKNGTTLPEDQLEFIRTFTVAMVWTAAVVGPWLMYTGLALIFWLLFKVLGSEMGFKQSLSVVVHGYTPFWLVAALVSIPIVFSLGELTVEDLQGSAYLMSNLGFLANEDTSQALRSLLESIDLFSVWSIVLLTLGFRIVGRVSTGKAAGAVLFLWSIYIVLKVGAQSIA